MSVHKFYCSHGNKAALLHGVFSYLSRVLCLTNTVETFSLVSNVMALSVASIPSPTASQELYQVLIAGVQSN